MPRTGQLFSVKFTFMELGACMVAYIIYCIVTAIYICNQNLLSSCSRVAHFPLRNFRSFTDNYFGHSKFVQIRWPYLTFITADEACKMLFVTQDILESGAHEHPNFE